MSFGIVAASYLGVVGPSGITQQNSGTWSGTTMPVSLPGSTNPSSLIALFVAGNVVVDTPAGWTLRQSSVDMMGHYLFTLPGGTNSWNITTHAGIMNPATGTWYAAEIGGTYETGASDNDFGGDSSYTTPTIVPTAGSRLLIASIASVSDDPYAVRTVAGWTNGFSEVADVCNPAAEYPMQGVAARTLAADGVSGYATSATYSINSSGRSAIIAAFTTS